MLLPATCDITAMPGSTQTLVQEVNEKMPESIKMDHFIGTVYIDGEDNIDDHSDKQSSFAENSWFLVIKFGASRPFEFKDLDGRCFFHEELPAGTAIWVKGSTANLQTTHGVPYVNEKYPLADGSTTVGVSGSLVFRSIATIIPWEQVHKEALASQKDKRAAREKKGHEAWTASRGKKKLVQHHERLMRWARRRGGQVEEEEEEEEEKLRENLVLCH